jgi:uncharacterized protein with NAD-binding domain and iron-sulfur cluster
MAAAFELSRPEHRGQYHVTVYQQGWRLGGKGASGRGPGDRIEEHGLHVWMGFYENAFRLLRECYAELGRDPASSRFARWDDVFQPDPTTGVMERDAEGDVSAWLAHFPPSAGTPGDPDHPGRAFTVNDYLVRLVQLVEALLRSARDEPVPAAARSEPEEPLGTAALIERVSRVLRLGQLATLTGVVEATRLLQGIARSAVPLPLRPQLELVDLVRRAALEQLDAFLGHDREMRRIHHLVDLMLAVIRGALRFRLASHPEGFDAINDYEWREWLLENGASRASVNSSFVTSLYNLPFAFEDGDHARPRAAAGDALRCCVLAFANYRGSFFWKMRTGMGDAVFAPFYEVLRRRGVSFRFFHRLENVALAGAEGLAAGEPAHVEALDFDVQAETVGGADYEPLVDVRGLPCWPAEPDWSQLRDGARLRREGWDFESFWDARRLRRRRLEVGRDFDFVILGVGLGAVPHVAPELVEKHPAWRTMVREVKTTATQAFQLWLRTPVEELGWEGPPVNVTASGVSFETWADMGHLIPDESFPETPRALAYFCSSLPATAEPPSRSDTGYLADQRKRVRDAAIHYLNHEVSALWPKAVQAGRFRWELLVDARGRPPEEIGDDEVALFESQFWTANVNPSDRYVLSVPGSSRHRISPLDPSIDNLSAAGDWTACGLDVGCVEAAVISGRLAAASIAGLPHLRDIPGFDHP